MIELQATVPMTVTEEQAFLLRKLERAVEREQRIAGYPKLKKHMTYSESIKNQVIDAYNSGATLETIAARSKISMTRVAGWCAETPRRFEELPIVEDVSGLSSIKNQPLRDSSNCNRSIELRFPSGVIMQISRGDLDESLLKTLMTRGG